MLIPAPGAENGLFYIFNMDEGTQTRPFVDYTIPSLALLQGKYWIPTLNSEELFSQKNGKDTSFQGRIQVFFLIEKNIEKNYLLWVL